MNVKFANRLLNEILNDDINIFGEDNYDANRFGLYKKNAKSWKDVLINKLDKSYKKQNVFTQGMLSPLDIDFDGLDDTWNLLQDEYSKNLLLKLIEYRLLGYTKVKIPIRAKLQDVTAKIKATKEGTESIDVDYLGMHKKLYKYDLQSLGHKINLFGDADGLGNILAGQYQYADGNIKIMPELGDVCIDGGGCWGDVALIFADLVGVNGKVFSYEFVPKNLDILYKNLDLNNGLKRRIEVVQNAILDKSGEELCFDNNGPATRVGGLVGDNGFKVKTLSVDDLVKQNNLCKLDFIKFDIECCELNGLKGAVNSLKKFRPKLAISIYHKNEDFVDLPKFLDDLHLGYKFYLDHYTIHAEETVLYATCR
jgi:FkbM family methyltransferase